jgi:hypothetical protein
MTPTELARLERRGREMEERGESFLAQFHYQKQIHGLQRQRAEILRAATKKNPNDKAIPRGVAIADIDAQLRDLSVELLRVTPVCRQFPN